MSVYDKISNIKNDKKNDKKEKTLRKHSKCWYDLNLVPWLARTYTIWSLSNFFSFTLTHCSPATLALGLSVKCKCIPTCEFGAKRNVLSLGIPMADSFSFFRFPLQMSLPDHHHCPFYVIPMSQRVSFSQQHLLVAKINLFIYLMSPPVKNINL